MNPRNTFSPSSKCSRFALLALFALSGPIALASAGCSAPAQSAAATQERIDAEALITHVRTLSADSMEGRRTGTPGNERARDYIVGAFEAAGLEPVGDAFLHPFVVSRDDGDIEAWNILGMVEGTEFPDRYIVVTGHYDHLGIRNDEIFNGADDNASGAAAVIALGDYFRRHPPRHSMLFLAPDAEEMGLRGARVFVADPPVPLEAIVLNVNADMVSHSEVGELYAAGTHHYPFLGGLLDRMEAAPGVTLLRGHDTPDPRPVDDWTMQSDHAAFHEAEIPFLYFGVEDHPHYHSASDEFEIIHPDFHHAAVETILNFILVADASLDSIAR